MADVVRAIQLLVAPVVMISACGLLCLALYNRLAVIVGRARAFNRERLEAREELLRAQNTTVERKVAEELERRLATLDDQVRQILVRARLVRGALLCLLTTVLCMIASSLALGISTVAEGAAYGALAAFVLGALAFACGVVLAFRELLRALDPLVLEGSQIHVVSES